jgi:DNA-binding transcriptional regulator YiaG
MPNIASVLKQEITRLAAKQVRMAVSPLNARRSWRSRRLCATLRGARGATGGRGAAILKAEQDRSKKLVIGALPAKELAIRITAKGMRSLRKKQRLSQAEFARLVGVSMPTVWQWEKKTGALKVRDETKKAIFAIRDLGAREAQRRLDDMPTSVVKNVEKTKPAKLAKKKRKLSAAGIARIRAGVKARWAKVRADKAKAKTGK